ncbi:MAG: hypothetical protein KBC73_21685 [Burkholderiaceae bacterium]|nr:hypothetical protein [Burkholderiaceae bacterium]
MRRRPIATALLALLLLITQQLALLHVHPAAGGHGTGVAASAAADTGEADAAADLLCAPCLALSQLATLLPPADWPPLPGDAAQAAPAQPRVAAAGGHGGAPYQARAPPRLSALS